MAVSGKPKPRYQDINWGNDNISQSMVDTTCQRIANKFSTTAPVNGLQKVSGSLPTGNVAQVDISTSSAIQQHIYIRNHKKDEIYIRIKVHRTMPLFFSSPRETSHTARVCDSASHTRQLFAVIVSP